MNWFFSKSHCLLLVYIGLLAIICYAVPREAFGLFIGSYTLLFILYIGISKSWINEKVSMRRVFTIAVLTRVVVALDMPSLSDDVYRFLWDGHLLVNGENPYQHTPEGIFQKGNLSEDLKSLYPKLNSRDYFSVYPPTNQLVFAVAAWAGSDLWSQVLMIRVILLVFECWSIYLVWCILRVLHKPSQWVWWYVLNPLVILEVMGNLHFEGIMLSFMLLGIWTWLQQRDFKAGAAMGMAVGVKLTPLILLPLLFFQSSGKRHLLFVLGLLLSLFIVFVPLVWESAYVGFYQSLQLYYGKFEFNALVYYLLREIGYWWKGYNTIAYLSKGLGLVTFLFIIGYSIRSSAQPITTFIQKCTTVYLIYLLLSLVVHPWYLVPLIGLGVLSGQFYPLVWSYAVMWSYSAYQIAPYQESWLLIVLEYSLLFAAIYFEKYLHILPKTFNFK